MIDTITGLRALISYFLAGVVPFETLDAAVARVGETVPDDDPELFGFWGTLELLLAERSSGHMDDAELRAELSSLVPASITIGPRPTICQFTATASRSITSQAAGLILGPLPPVADTRVAVVHA